MTLGRKEGPLMRGKDLVSFESLIAMVVGVGAGVLISCVFIFFYAYNFFSPRPLNLINEVILSPCASAGRINLLRYELASLLEKNEKLNEQLGDLTMKVALAEKEKEQAQNKILASGKQHKAGPFGTVKALRTNPTVLPDESINPRLAKILEKIAVRKELIVAIANSNVKEMLEIWFNNIKRVGASNYLVVALDDDTENICKLNEVPVYRRNPVERIDTVSGMKFQILREFLQLGYSVLFSDVDIVYLQNPFDYLYRDSDVESMSDGHNNRTAYGYDSVSDEPSMGWSRYAHTIRIWVYNTGFFYIRPTIPSIDLLDRVADRFSLQPQLWDKTVFDEQLYIPSHPGYDGLHASRRTMDMYLFMNSKVLFKIVRKDAALRKLRPVVVHVNYHQDKLSRMKAVVEFYVEGKQNALESFSDGSEL